MREHLPAERQDWTGGEEDTGTRELVRRYADATSQDAWSPATRQRHLEGSERRDDHLTRRRA